MWDKSRIEEFVSTLDKKEIRLFSTVLRQQHLTNDTEPFLPKSRYDAVQARNKELKKKIEALERALHSVTPDVMSIKEWGERSDIDVSVPRSIPRSILCGNLKRRLLYLPLLFSQNWEELYPLVEEYNEDTDYYVYVHVDPTKDLRINNVKGLPFYVGKGRGDRICQLKRNQGHDRKLNNLLKKHKKDEIVHKLFSNLTEQEAFELEAKLIYLFGSLYDGSRTNTYLTNLQIPATPDFIEDYPEFFVDN